MTAKEELIEESKHIKSPHNRKLLTLASIMLMVSLVIAGVAGYLAYSAANVKAQQGRSLAEQVREACANPQLNTDEMQGICKKADQVVEEPASPSVPLQGKQGEQGVPGPPPSDAQVSRAVLRYCASFSCRGTDGKDATQAQVRSAVAMYCNARGECIGPEGQAGEDGQDGQDGSEGKQGPPPSDAQVAKAVADYCSTRNECRGQAGTDGAPGRGIQSIACTQGNASFTITYTDGTTETVECPGGGNNVPQP